MPDRTRYYVDGSGRYIGGFAGSEPPPGAVEVPSAPNDARQRWNGAGWDAVIPEPEAPAAAYYRKLRGAWVDGPPEAMPDSAMLALRLVAELAKELDTAGAPMTGKLRGLVARIRAAEAGA